MREKVYTYEHRSKSYKHKIQDSKKYNKNRLKFINQQEIQLQSFLERDQRISQSFLSKSSHITGRPSKRFQNGPRLCITPDSQRTKPNKKETPRDTSIRKFNN